MKTILKTFLFTGLLMVSMMSCNQEELFVEPVVVEEETPNNEDTNNPETPTAVDTSLPCDFTLNDVQANSTVVINCIMDLGGETINLPENVTIVYEGGDITNGTLNFSSGSTFDGNFLNSTLTIAGTTPLLKDPSFQFIPSRWGIVEGKVSDEVALNNRNILNNIFTQSKEMGINTFKIDKMDAYFLVSKEDNFPPKFRMGDIFIPSDFNLVMTDNTHLRVQPNGFTDFTLLAVYEESNVTITGGNLHGDRDEHDYSTCGGREWCQDSDLLRLEAAANVVVDGVNFYNSTADAIMVKARGFSFNPDYDPSNNIVIKNCILDKSRRNNISIVNAHNVIVEDCQILNAGIDTDKSLGTNPKAGIDIEALRGIDDNGNYIYYEIVRDVIIRNNIEKGSARSAIIVAIGDDTVIENNETENGISYSLAKGVKIRNNRITGTSEKHLNSNAIGGGVANTETTYNNEISGNIIKGYGTGITLYAKQAKVYDNVIENAGKGIFVPNQIRDTEIYGNTITNTTDTYTRGIYAHTSVLKNVQIHSNNIDVKVGNAVSFESVNENTTTPDKVEVTVYDNFFNNSSARVFNSKGIQILKNN
ncbi:NosD domain-containing protein [Gelatiniphilus marinus]|uniref:NosD domain-containing protein n=1 Tax=Gelatiniphilus marinus TaxID=1759464 RepID=A0ABW5JR78_9FLAO